VSVGRPPRSADGTASASVKIRLTPAEVERFGRLARAAGMVRPDGTPAIGAWLRSLGNAAP
jgi:hypothetical protein